MQLPSFREVEKIAEGGFSTVYSGIWTLSEERLAIKVAKPGYSGLVLREARLQYSLSNPRRPHPNIVEVVTFGEETEASYFGMELMDGSLKPILEKRLPLDQATEYLEQILRGLYHAHRNKVIHGDLKPGNILLKRKRLKLSDFGLGIRYKDSGLESSMTRESLGGTIEYIAPEIIGRKEFTEASDIYSLGVLMHELFTGRKPEHGTKPQEMDGHITERVGNLILACLKRDPSERVPDVEKVIEGFGIRGSQAPEVKAAKVGEYETRIRELETDLDAERKRPAASPVDPSQYIERSEYEALKRELDAKKAEDAEVEAQLKALGLVTGDITDDEKENDEMVKREAEKRAQEGGRKDYKLAAEDEEKKGFFRTLGSYLTGGGGLVDEVMKEVRDREERESRQATGATGAEAEPAPPQQPTREELENGVDPSAAGMGAGAGDAKERASSDRTLSTAVRGRADSPESGASIFKPWTWGQLLEDAQKKDREDRDK